MTSRSQMLDLLCDQTESTESFGGEAVLFLAPSISQSATEQDKYLKQKFGSPATSADLSSVVLRPWK